MNENELICPFCFSSFPPQTYAEEVPICRECRQFGRSIILEDQSQFLADTPRAQMQLLFDNWRVRKDFLENEREIILRNLTRLLSKTQDDSA
jgi:hypothetical protein